MNVYYKIYKLYQRKLSIQQISATMHIPEKTIKDFIARLESKGRQIRTEDDLVKIVDPFLDFTVTKHHRHVVIDFSGMLTENFVEVIDAGLEEARKASLQFLTVKLDGILEVDDKAMQALLEAKEKLVLGGKVVVLLAPSDPLEEYIEANDVEKTTRIFGTQSAFEDYLFRATFDKNR